MANPVISRIDPREYSLCPNSERAVTYDDIVVRAGGGLGLLAVVAAAAFFAVGYGVLPLIPTLVASGLVGFGLVLASVFRKAGAGPVLFLAYCAVEGVFVGAASYLFTNYSLLNGGEANGQQIILYAVVATIGTFIGMLVAYSSRVIRVTPGFIKFVIAATFGVLAIVLVNLVFALLGIDLGIRTGGPISIIFSLVVIVIAALNLALDFHFAERAVQSGAPQRIAWDLSLGLVVTIVWLYLEFLRLFSFLSQD